VSGLSRTHDHYRSDKGEKGVFHFYRLHELRNRGVILAD
jgi:hypothetical protein